MPTVIEIDVGTGDRTEREMTPEEIVIPMPPTKSERISALTAEYKADLAVMNNAFLAAQVAGGATLDAKIAAIRQDIADRRTQYNTDLAIIRNS